VELRETEPHELMSANDAMPQDDSVKLGDFGLSKILGSNGADMAQSAVGTPYYLSPELCEGRPYDYKSDVWALGCVTYEMTTLRYVRSCRQAGPPRHCPVKTAAMGWGRRFSQTRVPRNQPPRAGDDHRAGAVQTRARALP